VTTLAGKTLFITGASRGIGLAIGLRAAKDGANVVIAAKTSEPNPKLPGTIHTAAAEIEAAGGKALACIVDVRDEDAVKAAVKQAVDKFGGIDILVNNASAISLTDTASTPMKRYDLMHQINTRGTYLCSQVCLPYLLKAENPHILNLSPPLNMEERWFAPHVAYTMAKFGMSMCVLGMAGEFRSQGIAVNALWPRTAIATAAVANLLGGESTLKGCRTVDIMSDAAHVILTRKSREFTGQFVIDEDLLRAEGVTDFEPYAVTPGAPLVPDFFVLPFSYTDLTVPTGPLRSSTPLSFSPGSVHHASKIPLRRRTFRSLLRSLSFPRSAGRSVRHRRE
jgi:citronellol/citronellal dehydrogenase